MSLEPRERPEVRSSESDQEMVEEPHHVGPAPSPNVHSHSLLAPLERAIARGDLAALWAQLELRVVAVDGRAALREGGLPLEALEPASARVGYRDAAPVSLGDGLGPARVAALTVDALSRAAHSERAGSVIPLLRSKAAKDTTLVARMRDDAVARRPEVLTLLAELDPTLLAPSVEQLLALADARRAEIEGVLPRLALGAPRLNKAQRNALAPLLHAIAVLDHPDAPDALRVLVRAGVPVHRKIHGKLARERAGEARIPDNLRALEAAEPPLVPKGRPSSPGPRVKTAAPKKKVAARQRPAAAADLGPRRRVRPGQLAALVGVATAVGLGMTLSSTFAILVLYATVFGGMALLAWFGWGVRARRLRELFRRGRDR